VNLDFASLAEMTAAVQRQGACLFTVGQYDKSSARVESRLRRHLLGVTVDMDRSLFDNSNGASIFASLIASF
jgi:hypothetical protein